MSSYCTYIFKGSTYKFFSLLFKTYFKNGYFDTSISNDLEIFFSEFFSYCFYMYNFIFQRLIWRMISFYFLSFDYWTLEEWNEKRQNYRIILSQRTNYYTYNWPTQLNVNIFTAFMFIFFVRFLSMCKPRTAFYLLYRASPPGLAFILWKWLARLPSWLVMVNAG